VLVGHQAPPAGDISSGASRKVVNGALTKGLASQSSLSASRQLLSILQSTEVYPSVAHSGGQYNKIITCSFGHSDPFNRQPDSSLHNDGQGLQAGGGWASADVRPFSEAGLADKD
jgi:hypothetical protein